ncbi:MAG: hypothetical protein A2W09_09070 [Deltaproteobacteria bacterium RBG_16_50_11]|nr:MAG: hypothetical protein A2W09_09070 [Deltaproteobacteria bacterium RBG_16_50_11]
MHSLPSIDSIEAIINQKRIGLSRFFFDFPTPGLFFRGQEDFRKGIATEKNSFPGVTEGFLFSVSSVCSVIKFLVGTRATI